MSFKNDAILQVPLASGSIRSSTTSAKCRCTRIIIPPPERRAAAGIADRRRARCSSRRRSSSAAEMSFPPPQPRRSSRAARATSPGTCSVIDAGLPRVASSSTRSDRRRLAAGPVRRSRPSGSPTRLRQGIWTVHSGTSTAPRRTPTSSACPGRFPSSATSTATARARSASSTRASGSSTSTATASGTPRTCGPSWAPKRTGRSSATGTATARTTSASLAPSGPAIRVHLEHEPGLPDQDNQRVAKRASRRTCRRIPRRRPTASA